MGNWGGQRADFKLGKDILILQKQGEKFLEEQIYLTKGYQGLGKIERSWVDWGIFGLMGRGKGEQPSKHQGQHQRPMTRSLHPQRKQN